MYRRYFKRMFDLIFATMALAILSPLFVVTTIWLVKANKGAGAFFTQRRPGKHGKVFKIIKFKSMTDERDSEGNLLPDDERLTRTGILVRSTSIDELPQLINIIKGEMSLIGPRPLLEQYLPLYSPEQARRHEVLPGITGWAQCHGRNTVSWDERFRHDVWYVDHCSLATDLRVCWLTAKMMLGRDGIASHSSPTMEHFKGNH